MASYLPLVLYDCVYENIDWHYEPRVLTKVEAQLENQWQDMRIRTAILNTKRHGIADLVIPPSWEKWSTAKPEDLHHSRRQRKKPYSSILKACC